MSTFAARLGRVIRRERLRLGLSQEALAALSGMNRASLSEIERGAVEISAFNLQRIADAMRIKLSALIRMYEDEP
jgi:transcriptional regulator with XRE-family HTH domain